MFSEERALLGNRALFKTTESSSGWLKRKRSIGTFTDCRAIARGAIDTGHRRVITKGSGSPSGPLFINVARYRFVFALFRSSERNCGRSNRVVAKYRVRFAISRFPFEPTNSSRPVRFEFPPRAHDDPELWMNDAMAFRTQGTSLFLERQDEDSNQDEMEGEDDRYRLTRAIKYILIRARRDR